MSTRIEHSLRDVTLLRHGAGFNTQWIIDVEGQTGDDHQQLIINDKEVLDDIKDLINQVEHAAKILGLNPPELGKR